MLSLLVGTFLGATTVEVKSIKKGAFIYVDGVRKSIVTSTTRVFNLDKGKHTVKVVQALDDDWQEESIKHFELGTKPLVLTFSHFTLSEIPQKKHSDAADKAIKERYKKTKNSIIDTKTSKEWQDNIAQKTVKKNWNEAIAYCKTLALGEHTNWRLPTHTEILDIIDYSQGNPVLVSIFKNVSVGFYWTADEEGSSKASRVYVDLGCRDGMPKDELYKVTCIREIK